MKMTVPFTYIYFLIVIYAASLFFGIAMFKIIAIIAAGTIPEPPKISSTNCGKLESTSVFAPRPYPRPKATDTIVTVRCLHRLLLQAEYH